MSEQLLQKNKALQELLQACAEAFEEIHGAHSTDRDTCIEMRGRIRDELAKQVEPSLDGWAPCSPELLNSGVCCATAPRLPGAVGSGISHYHPAPAPAQDERDAALLEVVRFCRFVIKCVRRNGKYSPLSMQTPDEIEALLPSLATRPAQTAQSVDVAAMAAKEA